ncbi:exopolysaccharide biosynthesis polyprenyl glycosylphosphotransferase [uncultured Meiothermus sp.]|jgi:lipopolysaccharide/colanic/teichoic acid biosynthesis glycosyltransferase|uniref:exopolysaccharide biosynthesis polyprenyl glycosylphosphotransferase n=1 Tax=uncultured Meiothermus sp. TaxID=157471 RepID=UPI0026051CC3|nr:exopolysaccharide biosynthesis polyprenyl glycosylphosphotransferase [uncultured Meiothermus sp.]
MSTLVLTNNPAFLRARGRLRWVLFSAWHGLGMLLVAMLASWVAWDTWRFWTFYEGQILVPATLVAYGVSVLTTRRLLTLVGTNTLITTLVSIGVAFVLLITVLAMGRFYYSRSFLLVAFLATFLWQWLGWRWLALARPRIGLIPGGLANSLLSLKGAEWVSLEKPGLEAGLDGVAADLHMPHKGQWVRFMAECSLRRVPVYHAAAVYELLTGKVSLPHHSEELMDAIQLPPLYPALKRLLDLVAVLLALPLLLPLAGLLALLIRLESAGPVLFFQERMGQGGRTFWMVKFRSMTLEADDSVARFAEDGDSRVTRVGKWLRKFRLDELPQFWNVLRGEMSIIGPRPEQVWFAQQFEAEIPFYAYRHLVKPGITGWAQINQGYAADSTETREKLAHDLFYIKHLSLWLDSVIVVKTIRTILTGFGAR